MTKMLAKDLPQGTPPSPPAARTRRSNPLGTGGTGGVLDVSLPQDEAPRYERDAFEAT